MRCRPALLPRQDAAIVCLAKARAKEKEKQAAAAAKAANGGAPDGEGGGAAEGAEGAKEGEEATAPLANGGSAAEAKPKVRFALSSVDAECSRARLCVSLACQDHAACPGRVDYCCRLLS